MSQHESSDRTGPEEREVFQAALRIESDEQRERYLDRICGQQTSLRERVEKLLDARFAPANLLRQAVVASASDTQATNITPCVGGHEIADVSSHRMIGPYKVLERLGQGGMGTVYMAEQLTPLRRKVALKVIKAGMDTAEVVARFEAERQALAMMDHPNIAKVLDGGTTNEGRPYFVMELVRGIPITKFCQQHNLGLRERLALFISVCRAVQHAHQKGIIHRDLKPSNLLVTLHDHLSVVKVIDFGVAKALTNQLTDRTHFTHFAQLLGTPLYMSPEQAELSGLDVDTRSDIYSLGVVLYELLTGTTPVPRKSLTGLGVDDIRKLICDSEPPPPSARVSTLEADPHSTVSEMPRLQNQDISKPLRRELDWVVMKALQKDRRLRYESALDLARDVERFLNLEPVHARAPSWSYRTRKAISRNKGIIAVATAILAALILGLGIAAWQAIDANKARWLAESRARSLVKKNIELSQTSRREKQARREAEELLYAVEINLASDALLSRDMPRVDIFLDRHRQRAFENRVPFEWLYLNQAVHAEAAWRVTDLGDVLSSQLSPDGLWLGVAARNGSLRVLHAESGELLAETSIIAGLNSVSWAQDSRQLACACRDGTIRLLEFRPRSESLQYQPTLEQVGRLRQTASVDEHVENDEVVESHAAVFSVDGSVIFSASDDALIRCWDLKTRTCIAELQGHDRAVEQLALSPDGSLLASASSDDSFQIWDLETRKPLTQRMLSGRVVCVAFSADGKLCAGGSVEGEIGIVNLDNGKTSSQKLLDGIESIAFLGDALAAGDRAGTVHLFDVQLSDVGYPTLRFETNWAAHEGRVSSMQRISTGALVSSSRSGEVVNWMTTPHVPLGRLPNVNAFDFQSNGNLLLGLQQILGVELGSGKIQSRTLPSSNPWSFLAAARNSPRVAVANVEQIVVIDLSSGEIVARWPAEEDLHKFQISDDGRWLATAQYTQDGVRVRAIDSPKSEWTLDARSCRAICFAPDASSIAVGDLDDCLVYDITPQTLGAQTPKRLSFHDSTLTTICFSPDGSRLITGSNDRRIGLWDVERRELLTTITAHPARVECAKFSTDGSRIATCSASGHVRVWHSKTLQPLLQLFLDTPRPTRHLAFSPDQTCLVVSSDSAVYLVNPNSISQPAGRVDTDRSANFHPPQTAKLRLVGDLPGGEFQSLATGISHDGETVVGQSSVANNGRRPFVWTSDVGIRQLGESRDADNGHANCTTNAGLVSGGAGRTREEKASVARLWFADGSTRQLLPGKGTVTDLSADGRVAVLQSRGNAAISSWVWREGKVEQLPAAEQWDDERPVSDGSIAAQPDKQTAVLRSTPDGSVFLGNQFALKAGGSGKDWWMHARPVLWEANVARVLPGFDPEWNWIVCDLSDDAQVIVGSCLPQGSPFDGPGSRMFIYQAERLQVLDPPDGYLELCPRAVSGDGKTVVGRIGRPLDSFSGGRAFIWRAEFGIQDLNLWLRESRTEPAFTLVDAHAISQDSNFIVGYGEHADGRLEGYRVELH